MSSIALADQRKRVKLERMHGLRGKELLVAQQATRRLMNVARHARLFARPFYAPALWSFGRFLWLIL